MWKTVATQIALRTRISFLTFGRETLTHYAQKTYLGSVSWPRPCSSSAARNVKRGPAPMVLTIAALLFQIGPAMPVLPHSVLQPAVATESARSTSTQPERVPTTAGHNTSAATASASLTVTSLDTSSQNSLALSTIRVPEALPVKPVAIISAESLPSRRKWLMLSLAQHTAATFDAYSTRVAVSRGATEGDPLMRPFAHSPAIYAAIQVGPLALDFLARRMQRSQNNFLRHVWWLPQSASTGLFIFSGVHNLHVANHP